MTTAYVYASGEVGFSEHGIPAGALPLAASDDPDFRGRVEAKCRLAYDNKTCFLPGVPEADTREEAAANIAAWLEWALPDQVDRIEAWKRVANGVRPRCSGRRR